MSYFVDLDYVNRISFSLERFHWTQRNKTALFRCPLCGDSEKNKRKTRGSVYYIREFDKFCYKCFNCSASMSFGAFMKIQYPQIYAEYKLDVMKENAGFTQSLAAIEDDKPINTIVEVSQGDIGSSLVCLKDLPDTHPAVVYCLGRMIPRKRFQDIHFTDRFADVVCKLDANQLAKKIPNDSRIVFLMKTKDDRIIGIQGRSIVDGVDLRFVTIKFDELEQKSFGLNTVDASLPVFITEAAIDSLFLTNSIAIVGGDVSETLISGLNKRHVYVALDNEPRHKDTVRRMESAIKLGLNVCFWDIDSSLKDINMMVKAGITSKEIMQHIISHSKSGAQASMKLKQWSKV